jgi:uncharacterized protein
MEQEFSKAAEVKYAGVSSDERTVSILCHVLSIFFWIIPALVIYLVKKDDSPYVGEHAKAALNFQLSLVIYYIISGILVLLLVGIIMLIALYFLSIIACVIAAVKASNDIVYKYPFTIRFIQ